MSSSYEEKIRVAIELTRRRNGPSYPRHLAERLSLVNWLHTDVCHMMVDEDEVGRIMDRIIGGR